MIPKWRPLRGKPIPEVPYVADCRSFDVPNTICAMIRGLPVNCVAVTLRPYGGAEMISRAEATARRRGIRILWVRIRAALKGSSCV